MCNPIGIALGGLSFFSSMQAQKAQAQSQAVMQKRASEAEMARVLAQMSSTRAQQAAEQDAAALEIQKAQKKVTEAYGTAQAMDKGFEGNTLQDIHNSYLSAAANNRNVIQQQLAMNDVQREYALDSMAQGSYQNQVAINKPIAQPDFLGTAISSAGLGLNTGYQADQLGLT